MFTKWAHHISRGDNIKYTPFYLAFKALIGQLVL